MGILQQRYEELGGNAGYVKLPECIRVNTLKIPAEKLWERLEKKGVTLEKVPFLKSGFYVRKSKFSISALPEYLLGYFYIQEAASQLPAEILNPEKDDLVLDSCAAPGGKATQLALNAKAVVALEPDFKRRFALMNNIERLGIPNTIVCKADASKFDTELRFNKILVDAPCSGNYLSELGWFEKRDLKNFSDRAELQKSILKNIVRLLSPKGELLYSTCSLEPEENEMVVDWAIKNIGLKTLPIDIKIGDNGIIAPFGKHLDDSVANCKRFWPSRTGTQGFFMARMARK